VLHVAKLFIGKAHALSKRTSLEADAAAEVNTRVQRGGAADASFVVKFRLWLVNEWVTRRASQNRISKIGIATSKSYEANEDLCDAIGVERQDQNQGVSVAPRPAACSTTVYSVPVLATNQTLHLIGRPVDSIGAALVGGTTQA
jgi:hypothetical protein